VPASIALLLGRFRGGRFYARRARAARQLLYEEGRSGVVARSRPESSAYAEAPAVALGELVAWPRLAMNKVLSILPWKIGTPSSMHFEITSLR
jgi:hypothetical protein